MQLRSFVWKSQNGLITKPLKSNLENLISKDSQSKGAITELYNLLMSHGQGNLDDKRMGWSGDLGTEISQEDWKSICNKTHTQTINSRLRLLQYKWIM